MWILSNIEHSEFAEESEDATYVHDDTDVIHWTAGRYWTFPYKSVLQKLIKFRLELWALF